MNRVAIVGGGISGLSAAYFLSRAGCPCTLIEKSPCLGGVIRTERVDGCLLEAGPDSFISQKPWAMELIRELGIADQVIGSNDPARQTYICRGGRLVALPDGIQMMAPTKFAPVLKSRLFSWKAKAAMALEWFHKPSTEHSDRSVADFITDHYGREVTDYLAQPMLAGVYGGSAERLSAQSVLPRFVEMERTHGSLTRGLLRGRGKAAPKPPGTEPASLFLSLRNGMQQLVDVLAERIAGQVQRITGEAEGIEGDTGDFRVRIAGQTVAADQIILAVPAYEAARLLQPFNNRLHELLDSIPYSSSITAALLYDRAGWRHPLNGFGFLIPRAENRHMTACTWVNTKFPSRVAGTRVLLRGFLAGQEGEARSSRSDRELAELVHQECSELMGYAQQPIGWRIHRWHRAMAQYEVGHQRRIEEIEARMARVPGIHLAGNAYTGIGIPDCIRRSRRVAAKVAKVAENISI